MAVPSFLAGTCKYGGEPYEAEFVEVERLRDEAIEAVNAGIDPSIAWATPLQFIAKLSRLLNVAVVAN